MSGDALVSRGDPYSIMLVVGRLTMLDFLAIALRLLQLLDDERRRRRHHVNFRLAILCTQRPSALLSVIQRNDLSDANLDGELAGHLQALPVLRRLGNVVAHLLR